MSVSVPAARLTRYGTQQKPLVDYRKVKRPQGSLSAELTGPIDAPSVPDNLSFSEGV
ncbi:hypothetical protein [Erwinia sp.]|uniref:hypothetical protein n=1 Tax=Erwinia citreus TaxID=558 RepID=UPI00289ACB13|nr:hypothetical protein [Erwinia sp.]